MMQPSEPISEEASVKVLLLSELEFENLANLAPPLVVCFGQFDVIHPGHIRYLQFAKAQGATLIVALEGDQVGANDGLSSRYSASLRAQSLTALGDVDCVVILDSGGLELLVEQVRPNKLVLGKEYESPSLDQERKDKVLPAVGLIAKGNAETIYAAGETHYATDMLFRATTTELERDRWNGFRRALDDQEINLKTVLNKFKETRLTRLLVVGDSIIDRYIACDPIGMSNEAPIVVVRELDEKEFVGGAGIVAAHVSSLGAECEFVSVVGEDGRSKILEEELQAFDVNHSLIPDATRPTTLKTRFLVENQKMFRVSRLRDHELSKKIERELIDKIYSIVPTLSGIIVSDFVYGVITPNVVNVLREVSQDYGITLCGDLQCSSQIGDVSKFSGFDFLSPTEKEARIALNNHNDGVEQIANLLIGKTSVRNLIVKLGAEGFIAYQVSDDNETIARQHFPALSVNPLDVTGAGDSLLATIAVGLTRGLNLMEASALGACVSSLAVETVGNRPVSLDRLEHFIFSYGVD